VGGRLGYNAAIKKSPRRRELGRHVVADSDTCDGELTFKGTRIFVKHVPEQVANGMNRDEIVAAWNGAVTEEAIVDAIHLASDALIRRVRMTDVTNQRVTAYDHYHARSAG